jgi:hypothetical protein
MNTRPFAIALCVAAWIARAGSAVGDDIKSPDGKYILHNPGGQEAPGKTFEKQTSSITRNGDVIWSYVSYNKERAFFWSPDSKRILIVQPTGDGDVQAYVLEIQRDYDELTRLNQIALETVHARIIEAYPLRQGGGAQRSWIRDARWLSPAACEFHFFDVGEGYDADAWVKISCPDTGGPPKITVERIHDNFKERAPR